LLSANPVEDSPWRARIFGFRHSASLAILARPDAEKLSSPESEFALLGVRRAFYRAVF
jgi:hypothetical protein